ncbi:hypothetical protein L6452_36096 [Arctium lappa]|uniref:Uncharacterized protein n=1 Tax=Arctium lappa TaxID=4217 RepID=A0ACB8Y8Z1_ARCLA|nr:hypothetical protein L6452_36096 [Arctium lappa]
MDLPTPIPYEEIHREALNNLEDLICFADAFGSPRLRWDNQFVVATFDGPPTADSESYNKMDKSVRDAHEAQGACVQNVLDSLVPALLADKNRKFVYVEHAFFQRWWRDQSEATQAIVKRFVSPGQLELINGGWCLHDEAGPHYIDMIDQTILGHEFIKEQFNVTPRIGWQRDPFGHSAVQTYLLGAEVGFDSLFFGRIDYQDRAKRKDDKHLEVIWSGSKSLGSSSHMNEDMLRNKEI